MPITGVEAYFRPNRKNKITRKAWHLCLFAKNMQGWHNILRIVSTAYQEIEDGGGFYQKPCVDFELLQRYHEGIACTSACFQSWLAQLIKDGDDVAVGSYIDTMRNLFGDDFWLEIMPHDFDDQRQLNLDLVSIAQERGIGIIATNDAHFPYKEWAETQRIAKIMGEQKTLKKVEKDIECGKADYLAELTPTLYLAHEEEMRLWFEKHHPKIPLKIVDESIKNTVVFTNRITPFLLKSDLKLPKITESPSESEKILRGWIEEGLGRIAARGVQNFAEYEQRVESEFAILKAKGVLDYFVMVGEIVRWCKEQGIRVGLGRGSAAGCLVSYCIGITAIDPLAYGLLFERFLNPERKGLPDIDLDFDSERRDEVKRYIADRYGHDHVADIITHATFQPRKVIQDLCRAYDLPYIEAHELTDTIEIRQDDEETTLEELLPLNDKLQEFKQKYPEIWTHALRLEGSVANAGKHAAGIIITPKPIIEYMALERGKKKGDLVTSWSDAADFPVISDLGLVKLDALGVTGLTKHEYACRLIEERTGETIDLNGLPALYDPYLVEDDVMEGFRDGRTSGVFQFGGKGITSLLRDIQPDNILDLTAANALYRPGPMKGGVTWEYPKRKKNKFLRTFWHELVKPVLEETYGIIAFQEQVMEISKQIGGFSGAEADDLRKAMGKLYRIKGGTAAKDFMGQFEAKWFEGAASLGIDPKIADEIWHKMLEFGHYGFNKSHSASYALQAYQDMWLKIKYPAEFYAAFLTYEDDADKKKAALREARIRGIEIVLPDVNLSSEGFSVDDDERLVLGLTAIKGVGPSAAAPIVSNRPYNSYDDFLHRAGRVPHRELIESGALDNLVDRAYLLSEVDKVGSKSGARWQVWEHLKHNMKLKKPREVPEARIEPAPMELGRIQARLLNMPVSAISMRDDHEKAIGGTIHTLEEIEQMPKGTTNVIVGGEVAKVIKKKTAKGKPFANVTLVFGPHEWSVKFWEYELLQNEELLEEGNIIMVNGKKDEWKGNVSVVARYVASIDDYIADLQREEEVASPA